MDRIEELKNTLDEFRSCLPQVESAGRVMKEALLAGQKVLTAGNGGSAADALHLSEELVGRFEKTRPPYPALCLNADPTLLTCVGNDFGFSEVFSRQVEALGTSGDVLVVFSTSGNSENIVRALDAGKSQGLISISLLGKTGGAAKGLADHEVLVPSPKTARIQEVHTFVLHCWLESLEAELENRTKCTSLPYSTTNPDRVVSNMHKF